MKVIGLTGGIASGKSTVSKILKDLGAHIVDADIIAREIVKPQTPAWTEIVQNFGSEILHPNGEINRPLLGSLVFNNPHARSVLNSITHPRVTEVIQKRLTSLTEETPQGVAVIDAPLLIEAGIHRITDEVWLIAVPEEIQIQRLQIRDNLSAEEAKKRINAQMSLKEKMTYATRVIYNNEDVEKLKEQVIKFWQEILST